MKITLLKKGFVKYKSLELLALARNVLSKVNEPEGFQNEIQSITIPNLMPGYGDVKQLTDDYEQAIIAYENKGKLEKVIRDNKRAELENALRLWAMQIEVFANGDLEILINSGFDINKEPIPVPNPGAPIDFKVVSTNAGELILTMRKTKGVTGVQFELNMKGDPNIMVCTQSNNKCVMRDLQRGVYYECKAAYITKDHHKIYSEIISCVVK